MSNRTAVELGLHWLVDTQIRRSDGEASARGGVNQGYNWQERSYPFVYSEITGYAVSAFVNAFRWTGDHRYADAAQKSADFLIGIQSFAARGGMPGAIPHGLSLPTLELRRQYYSFDAAMCLQGLLDLHAIRPSLELRTSAAAIGDWLLERAQRESGAFLAMYDADARQWRHAADDVFGDDGCLHAKHAIGLLKLGRETGDERYTLAAQRVCDWVLELQDADGAFRATERLQQIVSHPHCYATEGLLYAHHSTGEERYLHSARLAGQWLLSVQNRDGSINIAYKRRWWRMGRRVIEKILPKRVTDATSQAIRIWLALYYLDDDQRYLDACCRAERFLGGMQCTSSTDPNAEGGFFFWPGHPIMFTWCTMFAVSALFALDHVDGETGYQRLMAELF